ncbi:MAG TPA: class I SAM-dependent methyltransferase [Syntrophales bacterium]|nr:class I SAM-dependent methyltransferase [Syntrophales bacterium]
MSTGNDRALRFYHEVLGLERLHYGMWLPEDTVSFQRLLEAQERYENYLVDNIPDDVRTILDVGCGTGVLIKKLISLGYEAEGLSPDVNQKRIFMQNVNACLHHSTFEAFSETDRYDCIIMSESAQYIKVSKLFKNAKRALKKDGHLMICDYFVLKNVTRELGKSGHDYEVFMSQAQDNGFTVVSEKDITESVTKTLDLGNNIAEKALKALDIVTEKARNKHPHICRFILWAFRKKIDKLLQQKQMLDSGEFKKRKTYRFILLQADGNPV